MDIFCLMQTELKNALQKIAFPRWTFLLLALLFALPALSGQSYAATEEWQPGSMQQVQEMPLLPYLDYYIDESLSMDIEEVAAADRASDFKPLSLDKLPRVEGIMWLRFKIAPQVAETKAHTYLLDMGQSIPGEPVLYDAVPNDLSGTPEWRDTTPAHRNILLMPEAGAETIVCYIRLDGLPGPWFAPMIRTPQNAASNWTSLSRTGAILALGVVMLLCLLRGMSESGQWRIWTALYVAIALTQAFLGMPAISRHAGAYGLAAVLTPGIALMLLPHVGRHLMRTPQTSKILDIQLLLLSLPGAALALLPLIQNWDWLERWLDLWPLATVLFVPTALGAWITGLSGARRFLAGCIIPPAFAAVSLVGLDFAVPADLLASLPLWGIAVSALIIVAARAPKEEQKEEKDGKDKKEGRKEKKKKAPPAVPDIAVPEKIIDLVHPLDDPNLRLIENPAAANTVQETDAASRAKKMDTAAVSMTVRTNNDAWQERENSLRMPLDNLLREGAALLKCSLSPAARDYAAKMIAAGNKIADILSNRETVASVSAVPEPSLSGEFNLQRLLRDAHDAVADMAEQSGTAVSWHIPPHLPQTYRGNGKDIEAALKLLVESSVRATEHGAVHVSVRRVAESEDPGQLLITIRDNGSGMPPAKRSALAFVRAWETAARYDGYISLDSGAQGTVISFSLHLVPADADTDETAATGRHVIIVSDDSAMLHELTEMLKTSDCRISEAGNAHEALVIQSIDPAPVLITQGRLASVQAADMNREFVALAANSGYAECSILAITRDESQWSQLKPSGFTHAMTEPVEAESLRQTVAKLLSQNIEKQAKEAALQQIDSRDADREAAVSAKDTINDDSDVAAVQKEPTPENPVSEKPVSENGVSEERLEPVPDIFKADDAENTSSGDNTVGVGNRQEQMAENIPERLELDNVSLQEEQPTGGKSGKMGNVGKAAAPVLDNTFVEWVGEPMPIPSAAKDERKSDSKAGTRSPADDFIEFVGEPMPITTPAKKESAISKAGADRAGESKTAMAADFVEFVGEPTPIPSAAKDERKSDSKAGPRSPADDFVEFVGEPMPITSTGKKESAISKAGADRAGESKTAMAADFVEFVGEPMPTPSAAKDERKSDSKTGTRSPADDFVEFVGEPMPITASVKETAKEKQEKNREENFELMPEHNESATNAAAKPTAVFSNVQKQEKPAPQGMDPIIWKLLQNLDTSIRAARESYGKGSSSEVAASTAAIAAEADRFGLRVLARMARCVERAARENDISALGDLLPELELAVERNRITFTQKKIYP